MTACFPMTLRREQAEGDEWVNPYRFLPRIPSPARGHIDEIAKAYGMSVEQLDGRLETQEFEYGVFPWAVLFFREELPLAGHVAELRADANDITMQCYSRNPPYEFASEEDVAPLSVVTFRNKRVMREAAKKSPLFAGAWETLRDRPGERHWVCIPDSPPDEWVMRTAEGDGARYMRSRNGARNPPRRGAGLARGDAQAQLRQALADEFYRNGNWDKAIEQLERVLQRHPYSALAWRRLGTACAYEKRNARAIEALERSIELEPCNMCAHAELGVQYGLAGRFADAAHAFRCVLMVHPQDWRAWQDLAQTYSKMGLLHDQLRALETLLNLVPEHAYGWANAGGVMFETGRFEEATQAFERALELYPQSSIMWNNLGYCYAQQGRIELGERLCRRALELDPESAVAWDSIGYCCSKTGRFAEAVCAYNEALALEPDHIEARYHLGVTYLSLGRHDEARQALEQLKTRSRRYASRLAAKMGNAVAIDELVPP